MSKTSLTIKEFALLFLALTVSVSASPYFSLGVENGVWIKYVLQAPAQTLVFEWDKLEFLNVTESSIVIRETIHMPSGSETTQTNVLNLTSSNDFSVASLSAHAIIIPSNSKIGDPVHLSQFGNRTIAGETVRTIAGAERTVVHLSTSFYGMQYTFYWDKQTGVLLENIQSYSGMSATIQATETNMWSSGPDWWFWIIILLIIVAVVGTSIAVATKKRIWKQREKTHQQKNPPTPTS